MESRVRPDFDSALDQFREFIAREGLPVDFIWLSKDRVTAHRRVWWIFRPGELDKARATKQFYESVVQTSSSIRIDAFPFDQSRTLAWVEDFGGPSKALNYGLLTTPHEIRVVQNSIGWHLIRLSNWLRDSRDRGWRINITPSADWS